MVAIGCVAKGFSFRQSCLFWLVKQKEFGIGRFLDAVESGPAAAFEFGVLPDSIAAFTQQAATLPVVAVIQFDNR